MVKKEAQVAIHSAATAAAAVAVTPIPFADAALLIPIQTVMIAKIYHAYGERISEGAIKGALSATTASSIGKGIVGNVFKLIPGLGTVAGAVLTGSTAVAITEGLGFAIANAFENDDIDNSDDLMKIIKQYLSNFGK
ncbi:DUF697 domain-containing protein [Lentilactobacillus kribbianus]|uniref:DUF697 domain-containing protein n=1 Tax=Lentilactobacillus kribbianus TaxID=2729622 RepID=UPI0015549F9E|nr:DUF697 domain-containing protein [Lentilactobacillus kribbianus]